VDDLFTHVIRLRDPATGRRAYFISRVMVLGNRSAGSSFCRVSNAIMWVVSQAGWHADGYGYVDVDDSMHLEVSKILVQASMLFVNLLCTDWGCPLKVVKEVAATQVCVWTGFEIDAIVRQIRIPVEYMARLRGDLAAMAGGGRSVTVKVLRSLVGRLQRAAECVWHGGLHMFALRGLLRGHGACGDRLLLVNLSGPAQHELAWWQDVAARWNGCGSWAPPRTGEAVAVGAAAACTGGFGGWWRAHDCSPGGARRTWTRSQQRRGCTCSARRCAGSR
jgi:hypothetical protein